MPHGFRHFGCACLVVVWGLLWGRLWIGSLEKAANDPRALANFEKEALLQGHLPVAKGSQNPKSSSRSVLLLLGGPTHSVPIEALRNPVLQPRVYQRCCRIRIRVRPLETWTSREYRGKRHSSAATLACEVRAGVSQIATLA